MKNNPMQKLLLPALLFAFAAPAMAQTKIAVANPIKILNELQETKDLNAAMTAERQAAEAEAKQRIETIKATQAERDQLKPDAPQWAELNKKFVQQQTEAKNWQQTTGQALAAKFREQAKRMHSKIAATISEVAKAKGYDLVLAEQSTDVPDEQLAQMQPQQIMSVLFGAQNVLYSTDAADLTQDVIMKLDAAYKSTGSTTPSK